MTHFDEMACLLYLEGQLEPSRAREMTLHLSECAECRTLLHALERESHKLRWNKIICGIALGICFWFSVPYQFPYIQERDPKLSPADRSRLKARYADRAMNFLRDALARGYAHPVAMRTDTDLDSLRARDDFRKLIDELEAQQKVSGGGQTSR